MIEPLTLGCDLSLNHAGIVFLRLSDWEPETLCAVVTRKKQEDRIQARGEIVFRKIWKGGVDRSQSDLSRLLWWRRILRKLTKRPEWKRVVAVGIEDYAFMALSADVYQYGELGGLARYTFRKKPLRLHDPLSVKLFVTGYGRSKPPEVEKAVRKTWNQDFRWANADCEGQRPSEDLATAYSIARMVGIEYLLRKGRMELASLPESQIRIFHRTTKRHPVNILGREWLKGRINV